MRGRRADLSSAPTSPDLCMGVGGGLLAPRMLCGQACVGARQRAAAATWGLTSWWWSCPRVGGKGGNAWGGPARAGHAPERRGRSRGALWQGRVPHSGTDPCQRARPELSLPLSPTGGPPARDRCLLGEGGPRVPAPAVCDGSRSGGTAAPLSPRLRPLRPHPRASWQGRFTGAEAGGPGARGLRPSCDLLHVRT
jgi:hypothetical protein